MTTYKYIGIWLIIWLITRLVKGRGKGEEKTGEAMIGSPISSIRNKIGIKPNRGAEETSHVTKNKGVTWLKKNDKLTHDPSYTIYSWMNFELWPAACLLFFQKSSLVSHFLIAVRWRCSQFRISNFSNKIVNWLSHINTTILFRSTQNTHVHCLSKQINKIRRPRSGLPVGPLRGPHYM